MRLLYNFICLLYLLLVITPPFTSSYNGDLALQNGAPWPMLGRNQFRWAQTPIKTSNSTTGPTSALWRYFLGVDPSLSYASLSSPSIGNDGTIYVGSACGPFCGTMYAIDGPTGKVKYTFSTNGAINSSPLIGSNNVLYFGCDDGNLYALDATYLTLKWSFSTGSAIKASPLLGSDYTIYIGSSDKYVYAIKDTGTSGTLVWKQYLPPKNKPSTDARVTASAVFMRPAFSTSPWSDYIAVPSWDNLMHVMSVASNGQGAPSNNIQGLQISYYAGSYPQADANPALAVNGTIFVGTNYGKLIKIVYDPTNGPYSSPPTQWYSSRNDIQSNLAILQDPTVLDPNFWSLLKGPYKTKGPGKGSIIFFGNDDAYLYAIFSEYWSYATTDPAFLNLFWRYSPDPNQIANKILSGPAIDGSGNVFYGTFGGSLISVGIISGTMNWKWQVPTSMGILSSISIGAGGSIYFTTVDGFLYAVDGGGSQNCPNPGTGLSLSFTATQLTFDNTTDCTPCLPGFYSFNSVCAGCPAGSISTSVGSTSCTACPIGKSTTGWGQSSCVTCSAGTYAATDGTSTCLACPPGSYSSTTGSSQCTQCPAGTYAATSSSVTCAACPSGTYSGAGASVCTSCPLGSYIPTVSSISCNICPQGTFASTLGSISCSACPVGYEAPYQGASTCSACPPNFYAQDVGQTRCLECPWPQSTRGDKIGSDTCDVWRISPPSDLTDFTSNSSISRDFNRYLIIVGIFYVMVMAAVISSAEVTDNMHIRITRLGIFVLLFMPNVEIVSQTVYFINVIFYNIAMLIIFAFILFFVPAYLFVRLLIEKTAAPRMYSAFMPDRLYDFDPYWLGSKDGLPSYYGKHMFERLAYETTDGTVYKNIMSVLAWIAAISAYIASWVLYLLIISPWLVFSIAAGAILFVIGVGLYSSRALSVRTVWDFWFMSWTGHSECNAAYAINLDFVNQSYVYNMVFISIPLFIAQVLNDFTISGINDTYKPEFTILNYVTFLSTIYNIIATIVRIRPIFYNPFSFTSRERERPALDDLPIIIGVGRYELCLMHLTKGGLNALETRLEAPVVSGARGMSLDDDDDNLAQIHRGAALELEMALTQNPRSNYGQLITSRLPARVGANAFTSPVDDEGGASENQLPPPNYAKMTFGNLDIEDIDSLDDRELSLNFGSDFTLFGGGATSGASKSSDKGGGKDGSGSSDGKDSKADLQIFKANASSAKGSDFLDLPKGRPVKEAKTKVVVHAQPMQGP